MENPKTIPNDIDIWQENLELRLRLEEAEETLRAIREGEVDGLIINSSQGEQVFTLVGADHSYRVLIEAMNEGALTLTADGIILYCNRSFARMMKAPEQELIGSSFFNLLCPSELCNLQIEFARNAGMIRREIDLLRGDGSPLPVHLSMNLMLVEGIEILSMVITDLSETKERANELKLANDKLRQEIAERQRAEEAMRQSEERFYQAFHFSPLMMAILSMEDNRFIEVNRKYIDSIEYSREELIGHTPLELDIYAVKEYSDQLLNKLKIESRISVDEHLVRTRSGKILTCMGSVETIRVNGMDCRIFAVQDITAKKEIEANIARLDRLNLIGQMAASIGHEIRNPMTAVRGFIQLLNQQEYYAKDKVYFDLMIEELDRANGIISEYLGMAKDKPIDLQPQYLDQIVNDIYPMLEADANHKGMNIELDLGKPPMTSIDKNEIRQLVLNIARNGMEAMSSGGTLTIGTSSEAGAIVLFIKDEGQGLPPELLDRLGTPFLTTKANGTGLGLAVCYNIATRHNARIDCETGPKGTTFKVYFPSEAEQITLF
ncbi:MAG: PAS domain S-box protein [Syntrophomonadaceae bacterium]|nr:PAS domain S-box protein [Syntrophomonadaceae bacterium]